MFGFFVLCGALAAATAVAVYSADKNPGGNFDPWEDDHYPY